MNVVYDPEKNILQIAFTSCIVAETAQIAPDLILDYDCDGKVIGLELRNASESVDQPMAIAFTVGQANLDKPQPYGGEE